MITVRIIKDWTEPDIFRQTPGSIGIWGDIKFTSDAISNPDYVIVFNYSPTEVKVYCEKEHIWSLQHEPPNEYFRFWHLANKIYYRVYTTDTNLVDSRYIHSQPALPWHVNKDYDFLVNFSYPNKPLILSWITSTKNIFTGHKDRMSFFQRIKNMIDCDFVATYDYYLDGTLVTEQKKEQIKKRQIELGFTKILKEKWDGLVPYRYALVIENYSNLYYWSEKLADCYLALTMPIYYGCTNITDYFPADSLVAIDINDKNVVEKIREVIKSDLWLKKRHAIAKARDLVLNKYQFFPYFTKEIQTWEKKQKRNKKQWINIPNENKWHRHFINKIKGIIF